jgi:hypothetical protein
MSERPNLERSPKAPRIRASQPSRSVSAPSWIHDRAPRIESIARERYRRERVWAWLSVVTLIICWDASARLDQRVSPPRVRMAHVGEADDITRSGEVWRAPDDRRRIALRTR